MGTLSDACGFPRCFCTCIRCVLYTHLYFLRDGGGVNLAMCLLLGKIRLGGTAAVIQRECIESDLSPRFKFAEQYHVYSVRFRSRPLPKLWDSTVFGSPPAARVAQLDRLANDPFAHPTVVVCQRALYILDSVPLYSWYLFHYCE